MFFEGSEVGRFDFEDLDGFIFDFAEDEEVDRVSRVEDASDKEEGPVFETIFDFRSDDSVAVVDELDYGLFGFEVKRIGFVPVVIVCMERVEEEETEFIDIIFDMFGFEKFIRVVFQGREKFIPVENFDVAI